VILLTACGILECLLLNKHKSTRSAVISNTYSAKMSRQHNDLNVLVISADTIGHDQAIDVLKMFLQVSNSLF
jgi:ribose 5-phosphate isomerase B